jgi:hypothetical protein
MDVRAIQALPMSASVSYDFLERFDSLAALRVASLCCLEIGVARGLDGNEILVKNDGVQRYL